MRDFFLLLVLALWSIVTVDILIEFVAGVDATVIVFVELMVALALFPQAREVISSYREKVEWLEKNNLLKEI